MEIGESARLPGRRGRSVVVRPVRTPVRARRVPFRRRLRYRFDNSLAHGPLALIGWLGAVVALIIVVAALVGHFLLGGAEGGLVEDFWQSVIRVLDASAFESEEAWPSRLVALAVPQWQPGANRGFASGQHHRRPLGHRAG